MEVEAKVLAAMRESVESLHGALETVGKKLSKNFRGATVFPHENPIHAISGALESCALTAAEVAKAVEESVIKNDEDKKDLTEMSEFAEQTLTKYERLTKGYVECPTCKMSGKIQNEPCKKCEGQGFIKTGKRQEED